MTQKREQIFLLGAFIAMGLAWIGLWGAWIQHPVPALRQNVIELSRWLPFFDAVRFAGNDSPHFLRLSASLVITGWAVSMVWITQWPLRWGLRLFTLIPLVWMMPPYPNILSPISNGLEAWLFVLGLGFAGVGSTLLWDRYGESVQIILVGLCALATLGSSVVGFMMVRQPFLDYYTGALGVGWGILLVIFASIVTVGFAIYNIKAKQGA